MLRQRIIHFKVAMLLGMERRKNLRVSIITFATDGGRRKIYKMYKLHSVSPERTTLRLVTVKSSEVIQSSFKFVNCRHTL